MPAEVEERGRTIGYAQLPLRGGAVLRFNQRKLADLDRARHKMDPGSWRTAQNGLINDVLGRAQIRVNRTAEHDELRYGLRDPHRVAVVDAVDVPHETSVGAAAGSQRRSDIEAVEVRVEDEAALLWKLCP